MRSVPKTMSTQHPDNIHTPFFAENAILGGDDEIKEAFYAFSHLGIHEQLWDSEGKEVDNFVVKKLLTHYEPYFRKHKLGVEKFLTVRATNPSVEKNEAKLLLEALNSIPRSYDIARVFYNEDIAPIFEVAIPMTYNARDVIRVSEYYKQYVAGKQHRCLFAGDVNMSEWLGTFKPEEIRVIPLLEDKERILNSAQITKEFIEHQKPKEYQRVWLARSDPALNYGSLAAVLMNKIALQRLHVLAEESSLEILPILGCGSAPFRGNLKPTNVDNSLKAYASVHTFTIQSAFKYDYPPQKVSDGVEKLNAHTQKIPSQVDEKKCLAVVEKVSSEYQRLIQDIAPLVNAFSPYIPERRKRKLHIGLFGYSRNQGGVKLPRAIKFVAALYSMGLPPELLGLSALARKDIDAFEHAYPSFEADFKDAAPYLNMKAVKKYFPVHIQKAVAKASELFDVETNYAHEKVTSIISEDFSSKNTEVLKENIARAAFIRGFLG